MNAPKFQPGDKVVYKLEALNATVVRIINVSDPRDVAIQGYRYEIRTRHGNWSVLEENLVKNSPIISTIGEA